MFLSLAANVTDSDFEQLGSVSPQVRATVIFAYLVGEDNGVTYNFKDIAKITGKSTGQAFSSICRCYNIGERTHRSNSGIYSINSSFSRKYNYKVTKDDILKFVSRYPNGCYPNANLEEFLLEIISKKQAKIIEEQEYLKEQEENRKLREKMRLEEENRRIRKEEEERKKREEQKKEWELQEEKEIEESNKWIDVNFNSHKVVNNLADIKINSVINFGRFYGTLEDEVSKNKRDMPWIILDADDENYLLLSLFIIKVLPFDENFLERKKTDILTLKNCSIYKWLDEYFYDIAFNQEEKKNISIKPIKNDLNMRMRAWSVFEKVVASIPRNIDDEVQQKIFILSYDELKKYSGDDYNNLPAWYTNYCQFDERVMPSYWTRTASETDKEALVNISLTGSVTGKAEINNYIPDLVLKNSGIASAFTKRWVGVRPAVYVKKHYIESLYM